MSWSRLTLRQARIHFGTLTTVAVLALVTSFLATAAPRAMAAGYDDALADVLSNAPELRRDILVNASLAPGGDAATAHVDSAVALDGALSELRRPMRPALAGLVSESSVAVRSQTLDVLDRVVGTARPDQRLNLRYDSGIDGRIRYVDGMEPGPGGSLEIFEGNGRSVALPMVEVAVSRTVAEQLKLAVGHQLRVRTRQPPGMAVTDIELIAQVSGIYEPADPGAPVWLSTPSLLEAQERREGLGSAALEATAVLSERSYARFAEIAEDTPRIVWHYRMDFATITVAQAPAVAEAVKDYERRIAEVDFNDRNLTMSSETRLDDMVTDFLAERRSAHSVLSLATYAVLAVAITVLALAAQLAAEQRRGALALMRARGGSLLQAVGLVVAEIGAVAIPAVVLGYVAATLLVPSRSPVPSAGPLAAAVAIAAVLLPAAFAAWHHRRVSKDERRDLVTTRPSSRRVAAEVLVVALAAAGAYTLHQRGLTTSSAELGTDPFLVSIPVLIALAAGLLALRIYPYPLRALGRLTATGRAAVPFLAVARASREAGSAALPLLALLMTLGLGVFGSVLDTSVTTSQDRQTWREVGADTRLESFGFEEETIARVAAVPGVNRVIRAYNLRDITLRVDDVNARPVMVIAVDAAEYAPLVRRIGLDVPLPTAGSPTGPANALLSADLDRNYGAGHTLALSIGTSMVDLTRAGEIEWFPGVPAGWDFVVISYGAVESLGISPPTVLYIDGPNATGDAFTEAAGLEFLTVDTRADRITALREGPLTRLVLDTFKVGLIALGAYSLLAVLLGLVLGADRRGRVVSYLRTLGLSRRQSYGLLALEVGPLIALAVVTGLVVGWLISVVVAPGIDLRPFTGGTSEPPLVVDPLVIVGLAVALAGLVGMAILVDAALNRRRRLGSVLRVGEQA